MKHIISLSIFFGILYSLINAINLKSSVNKLEKNIKLSDQLSNKKIKELKIKEVPIPAQSSTLYSNSNSNSATASSSSSSSSSGRGSNNYIIPTPNPDAGPSGPNDHSPKPNPNPNPNPEPTPNPVVPIIPIKNDAKIINDLYVLTNKTDCNVTDIINKAKEESRILINERVIEIKKDITQSMHHIENLIKNISLSQNQTDFNGTTTIVNNYNSTTVNNYANDKGNNTNNIPCTNPNPNPNQNPNPNSNTNPKIPEIKIDQDLIKNFLSEFMNKNNKKKKKKQMISNSPQQGFLVISGSSSTNIINKNINNNNSGNGKLRHEKDDKNYRWSGLTTQAKISKRRK